MGYHCRWLIFIPSELYHNQVRMPGVTRWQLVQSFDFGHVTRVEKLQDAPERYDDLMAAAICANDCVLRHVLATCGTGEREHFAPPVLMHTWPFAPEGRPITTAQAWLNIEAFANRQVIDVGYFGQTEVSRSAPMPPLEEYMALEHNGSLGKWSATQARLRADAAEGQSHMLVLHKVPFPWIPAQQVALWMQEAEDREEITWTEACKRLTTPSHFRAWRAFLHELGLTKAQVLFYYQ